MEAAFFAVTGDAEALSRVAFAGMTDPAIVRMGLRAARIAEEAATIASILERYLQLLPHEIAGAKGYRAHHGVDAALACIEKRERIAIGLGTGNLERGARLKLEPLGLTTRFSFGGFGSDAEDRSDLLRIGALRGAARLGGSLARCRVVVIGDTPRDVEAAQAIGAECLAVATSFFSADELRACGATLAVERLSDPDALAFL
jgi:phosphoglycolate phosphatase-like HAD superfamily hydrolase